MCRQRLSLWGLGLSTFAMGTVVLAVCHSAAADAPPVSEATPAEVPAVDKETVDSVEMSKAIPKIEQALQRIQRRAAGDGTLKQLANATIHHDRYPHRSGGSKGERISISAPTDDQIEIPTKTGPVKVPGNVVVVIEYLASRPDGIVQAGLFNGCVMWKTNDSSVFVKLFWCTRDANAADRLLTIVREELKLEDLRLIPMKSLDWPVATPAERLSQLLPPEAAPPVATSPSGAGGKPRAPERAEKAASERPPVFASPEDVVTAFRQAHSRKDWRGCFTCVAPAGQGAAIREFLFVAGVNPRASEQLVKAIEKHFKFKLFEDASRGLFSKELDELFEPLANVPAGSVDAQNTLIYEAFRKRIGDIPGFLADCCEQYPNLGDMDEIRGIRIEGDKASGYYIHTNPAPDPKDVPPVGGSEYLPKYYPWHFRKFDGSWLLADAPLRA